MLIIGPSGSGKTNALLNVIQNLNETTPIDKIYVFIYTSFSSIKEKMLELNILTIQLHLFSIQMTWMMFLLILTIMIKKENEKY